MTFTRASSSAAYRRVGRARLGPSPPVPPMLWQRAQWLERLSPAKEVLVLGRRNEGEEQ
jgi:hypothetical protein